MFYTVTAHYAISHLLFMTVFLKISKMHMFFIPIIYFPIFLINTMSSIQTISIIQGSHLFHHITYIYNVINPTHFCHSGQSCLSLHHIYMTCHTCHQSNSFVPSMAVMSFITSHIYDMSSIQLISTIHGSHVSHHITYMTCHTCHQSNSFPPSTAVMSFITSQIYDMSSIQLISAIHSSHVFHHITFI